jgi:D-beta-D-heptose 7-phosphate kinase/D-beta-D-heptose 1-phosphate adenosyltransferase
MNIAWVNGRFDCIHLGHLELLQFAHEKSDELWVGIESDSSIREKKGVGRPIQDEETRKTIVESFWFVDRVFIYNNDEELVELIKEARPNKMVLGEKHRQTPIIGSEFCDNVFFFPEITQYSTNKIVEKLSSSL